MQHWSRRGWLSLAVVVALGSVVVSWPRQVPAEPSSRTVPDPAALERTRATVQMLDDVYKGFVVQITESYVKAQEKEPAAKVAKKVFKHMQDKGWHTARLVDATGEPINAANAPKTDFEKAAIAQIKGGKPYFDEVGVKDGKPVLRAATIVPVVMKQCIACHPGKKEGDLLGAIVYEVPIK